MEMVRPDVTMYRDIWDGNDTFIGLVTVNRAEGCLLSEAAVERALIAPVINVIQFDNFRVEIWVIRHTMDWITGRLGDVGHVADIYFRKINTFVHNFWRGADLSGIIGILGLLYEEITYIHPHGLQLGEYIFV